MNNKIYKTINFYPIFYGLSADLIFWVAINTIFLTTVKHLSAVQINTIHFIGTIIAIIIQCFSIKIIRKLGNKKSVTLGTILLFISALLFTFSKQYYLFFLAQILYSCGFIFKQMDNVILLKNLKYLNKSEDYVKYVSKGNTLYSLFTCLISIFSGLLFNINNYFPMYICITICFINIFLSTTLYEANIDINEVYEEKEKIKLNKELIYIFILFGLFYGMVAVGQENSKLFMQYNMEKFLDTEMIAIYLSIFITISRIIRVFFDSQFMNVYNKLKDKIIYLLEFILFCSFILLLTGSLIGNGMIGIIIMSLGFYMYLVVRDPFDNFMKKICFDNCNISNNDRALIYLSISRKIGELFLSGLVAIILLKLNYNYLMIILAIIVLSYLILIKKILKMIRK